jgi:hypothetical protein
VFSIKGREDAVFKELSRPRLKEEDSSPLSCVGLCQMYVNNSLRLFEGSIREINSDSELDRNV